MSDVGNIDDRLNDFIINDYFIKKFFPTKERILHQDPRMPWANNVIYRNIIEYGNPGSGKTTLSNSIAGISVDTYGLDNVNARFREDGNLEVLMHRGLEPKLVNILFTDNATLRKQSNDTLVSYFTLRNKFYDRFHREPWNLSNGYILSIISLHRYHGINVDMRSVVDAIIIKDVSLNPYDKRIISSFIEDSEQLELLDQIVDLRFDETKLMNYSILVTRNKVGMLNLPPRDVFYFKEPERLIDILRNL